MKRHPLVTFFILAFVLPWFVWGTTLAQQAGWIGWHIPESLAFWIGLPVATFGTAALTGGWPALKDLLLRMIRVRVGAQWYLTALLVTPLLAGLTALVALVAGLPLEPAATGWLGILGAFAFNWWMWLITEEAAWRGFALPRMVKRFGALGANLLLGVIWAIWHLPLFFIEGSFQSQLPYAAFLLSVMATALIIGWVYQGARGSVLIAALLHASADVTIATTGVMGSGDALLWTFVGLQVAVAILAAWRIAVHPAVEARSHLS